MTNIGNFRFMLTPFDDYPIHANADPVAHPATGDPNHYDRYFFNGHSGDGSLFFAGAMGHYPVRGVVDAAFSMVVDGVEHSVFASGKMPLDRATKIGPIEVEVLEPLRQIRFSVAPNESNLSAEIVFSAKTEAIEEPRQTIHTDDGIMVMDNTRLTQWGDWKGWIELDGQKVEVNPDLVSGTRDRSWGVRSAGEQLTLNRDRGAPQVFWLWAPLHFEDFCTHLALHEHSDGRRWLQSALLVPFLEDRNAPFVPTETGKLANPPEELEDINYEIVWEPGRREIKSAVLTLKDSNDGTHRIEFEKFFTFRMRGIGYTNPVWSHGSNHGQLEVGSESIALADFDPQDISSIHIQNYCRVRYLKDDNVREGVGVLEQFALGDHIPTGLKGLTDGFTA